MSMGDLIERSGDSAQRFDGRSPGPHSQHERDDCERKGEERKQKDVLAPLVVELGGQSVELARQVPAEGLVLGEALLVGLAVEPKGRLGSIGSAPGKLDQTEGPVQIRSVRRQEHRERSVEIGVPGNPLGTFDDGRQLVRLPAEHAFGPVQRKFGGGDDTLVDRDLRLGDRPVGVGRDPVLILCRADPACDPLGCGVLSLGVEADQRSQDHDDQGRSPDEDGQGRSDSTPARLRPLVRLGDGAVRAWIGVVGRRRVRISATSKGHTQGSRRCRVVVTAGADVVDEGFLGSGRVPSGPDPRWSGYLSISPGRLPVVVGYKVHHPPR